MSELMPYPVYFECEEIDDDQKKKIQNYFQIRRKSGGGECTAITKVSDKVYRVDFKDQKAQQKVLERGEHKVEVAGSLLVLTVRSSPGPTAPGPISAAVSSPKKELAASPLHRSSSASAQSLPFGGEEQEVQVNPYLLQYLRDNAQANNDFNKELQSLHSTAKLCPENEKAIVRSLVYFDNDETTNIWKSEVGFLFEKIKSQYHCHFECEAEKRALLLKSCDMCQEKEDVKIYSESDLAVVVGTQTDVQARLKHANNYHMKVRGASFGQRQTRRRRFDHVKCQLLHEEIKQSLAKSVPKIQVTEEEGMLVFQGTVEEINKADDIIDNKEKMVKERTVSDVSMHFLAFLNKAYSSGQSLSHFLGFGEDTVIELMPNKIKIVSLSANNIDQTVETLKEKFTEEQMEVPNYFEVPIILQNHLKSEEKRMNSAGHKVHVDFMKNKVILLGHSKEVKELHNEVTEFILDQSNVEDRIEVPFPELAPKLSKLLILNGFDFTGVQFKPLQSGFVALEGPSSTVTQVRNKLRPFLQSIVKENVIIDKPGALRYFKSENGAEKLLDVASSHKCLIQLEDVTTASREEEIVGRYILKQGIQVIVYLGDITKQEADALVNAANEELRHGSGVALALSKAGGPEVQKQSSDLIKERGKIETGDVVTTSGGKLKCKKILHAVGPEKDKAEGRERMILEETVLSVLVLAESLKFESIALPCISSGVFGVPVDVCSEAIVSAVQAFGAVAQRLKKITLIDNRREVVGCLKAVCERMLKDAVGAGEAEGGGSSVEQTGAAPIGAEGSVRVEIIQGTLETQQMECLVCPMLGHQPTSVRVGQALKSLTGAALVTMFNQASGGASLPGGVVLVEGPPGLLSKAVIFINLIIYSTQQQEDAKKVLKEGIRSVLSSCEGRGFSSVAFPVLGPGLLSFPVSLAAMVLLQEIQIFEQKRALKTPFQIRIVIHPNDKEASKAFQAAQQTVHLKGFTNDANPNHASFYRHVSSTPSEVTALMGGVTVQIVQSDIIHEKCDVIVNSTPLDVAGLKAEPAGVSKAILTAAGPNVLAELRRVGQSADRLCSTGAGLLGCREIVHVQTERDPQDFKKMCKAVLKLCDSKGYKSVAFPAINTGIGQMDHGVASRAMLGALAMAITELSPKSVSVIRIVILPQPVFSAFRAELDNRFGQVAPPQNLLGKLKKTFKKSPSGTNIPAMKSQPAVCSVIRCTSVDISTLKISLESLVHQQLLEKEFELRELSRLDEMEVEAVQAKARSFGVSLDHGIRRNTNTSKFDQKNRANSGEKIVILSGLKEDVLVVADLVNKAIKKALSEDLQEKHEETLAQMVQWMYLDEGEDWKHFNLKQNYILEEAMKNKEVFKKMEIKGNKVEVNLTALEATDKKTGKKYSVKRCETDPDIELPGHWSPMAGEYFKKVELDLSTQEFQDIAQRFYKTAKHRIHKIERVQNYYLWCSFFVMRKKMIMKNGAAELGEKHLYHGTSAESCNCIERDRFDRNYTGQQGSLYGKGVYFAIDASYSTNDRYSKPDSAGLKRMYVARVLTGRHTLGNSNLLAPPPRGNDTSDRYDSLVDNLQSPSMFVIFHDDQAYPEYIITFIAELDNRFGQVAPPQNLLGKLKKKCKKSPSGTNIPAMKSQPAVCSVIRCTSVDISTLKISLESLVHQQLLEKEFELRELSRLDEMEVEAVQAKARSFGVSLDHGIRRNTNTSKFDQKNQANSGEKIVILSGLKEDVLVVADLVNKAIKKALSEDLQEKHEETLAQMVQWMYLDEGEDWKHFNLKQNYILEEAMKSKEVFKKMEIKGNKVEVNLTALEATDKKTGKKYSVKRCETDPDIELPGHWSPMAGEYFKKVELGKSTQEFQDIAQRFYKTAKHRIHKIERVQNYYLWCSFFVMRKKMIMKNGAAELGEKHLYHGTSAESCNSIERDRFDRNYTGQQGSLYGKGVYFAIDASYSTNDRYSKPDSAGLKRMYVARVLTGRHTLGNSTLLAPPPRGNDTSDRYDSLVDNLQSPSMFVIFHDDQAYPEYIITFM